MDAEGRAGHAERADAVRAGAGRRSGETRSRPSSELGRGHATGAHRRKGREQSGPPSGPKPGKTGRWGREGRLGRPAGQAGKGKEEEARPKLGLGFK